jgi:hypothetical protein
MADSRVCPMDSMTMKEEKKKTKSLNQQVQKIIYRHQKSGITILEMLSIPNYFKYLVVAIVTFLRFNIYNDMIMFYSGSV